MRSALRAAVIFAVVTLPALAGAATNPWRPLDSRDGVDLWQRPEDTYTVATFRSRSIIHAPITQVSAILWDSRRRCEWMDHCVSSELLEARGKNVTIQYSRTHTSAWVPDRDVVVQNELTVLPDAKVVRLTFHDVADERRPSPQWVVRIARLEGFFELRQLDAETTEVTYQTTIDPGGRVPATFMASPTLDAVVALHASLRHQAVKPGYDAEIAQLHKDFDWTGFVATASAPLPTANATH